MVITRREFIQLLGSTVVFSSVLWVPGKIGGQDVLVRPPGAIVETEFIAACSRCGKCIAVCPVKALRYATFKEGLANVGTPVLTGGCIACMDCIQVCTNRALIKVDKNEIKMGTIKVLPHCIGCGKCINGCRYKAITQDTSANKFAPVTIDQDKCIGCGECIATCPLEAPALQLTAEGAKRLTKKVV